MTDFKADAHFEQIEFSIFRVLFILCIQMLSVEAIDMFISLSFERREMSLISFVDLPFNPSVV